MRVGDLELERVRIAPECDRAESVVGLVGALVPPTVRRVGTLAMNRILIYSAFREQPLPCDVACAEGSRVADRCTVISDEELVRKMAARETRALGDFYDRYAGQVLGFLLKILGSRADAEDVLQETFWQAWNSSPQFDPRRCSVRGWFYLLARSRAIDCLRRRRSNQELDSRLQPATTALPQGSLEQAESDQRLDDALEQIPQEQAVAIRLAFFGGLTHDEVALAQSIPLGTAKTRIRLGMLRLRKILSEGSPE